MKKTLSGFTLIDLMISLLILSILAGIAIPSYRNSVMRGYLVNATNKLTAQRMLMEQYYQDNRQYTDAGNGTTYPCTSSTVGPSDAQFAITCPAASASTYTIQAAGTGQVLDFKYTINEKGDMQTTNLPSGWGSYPQSCWIVKKGQTC